MSEVKITAEVIEFAKSVFPEIEIPETAEDITADYFTQKKGELFISADLHKKEINAAVGKFKGSAETALRRIVGDAAKGKSFDEVLPMVEEHFTSVNQRIEELKAGKGNLSDTEKKELADLKSMVKEQEALLKEKETALTDAMSAAERKVEELQTRSKVDLLYKSSNWSDTANDYTRRGLWAEKIEGKFTFKVEGNDVMAIDYN